MQTQMSPIALRGFILGYMSKTASDLDLEGQEAKDQENSTPMGQSAEYSGLPNDKDPNRGGVESGSQAAAPPAPAAPAAPAAPPATNTGTTPPPPIPDAEGGQSGMAAMLKKLIPGAAGGAAAVGLGSAGVDMARDEPVNKRRAAVLAAVLGIPLGMATQMAASSAGYGSGPSLGEFGSQVASTSGEAMDRGRGAFDSLKGKAQGVGEAARTGLDAARQDLKRT